MPLNAKPFKTYADLVTLLESRGMEIEDRVRAERKLAQIGYYRFTGFSFPCRVYVKDTANKIVFNPPNSNFIKRSEQFVTGTTFNDVFRLYLMDKHLRLLMLDAIERIEVYMRSIIAHEMGFHSPTAYKENNFINPKHINNNNWLRWQQKHNDAIANSTQECILWHRTTNRTMPFWVVIEAWDFGLMSHYFSYLNGKYQNKICARIDKALLPNTLGNWLREINTLRNRCAHHTRIWNQSTNHDLKMPQTGALSNVTWGAKGKSRLFGLISVMWFLVEHIGKNSSWLSSVAEVIDTMPPLPACNKEVMGFPSRSLRAIDQFI
ncbi:Abi family protein [Desulfovibrio sp. QI0430]